MRLVDDTGRLIRAPEVRFSSDEIGLEQFGYNIDNRSLMVALEERAAELPNLTRFDDEAATIDPQDATVIIHTGKGEQLAARLVIGADGRQSPSRAGGRNRDQPARPASVGADVQHFPFAAAQQHLHRVSHPAGSMRVRAPARQPLQRVVWVSADQGSRAADVAQRRRIVGGRGNAVALHSRPRPGRSRAQRVCR